MTDPLNYHSVIIVELKIQFAASSEINPVPPRTAPRFFLSYTFSLISFHSEQTDTLNQNTSVHHFLRLPAIQAFHLN